VEKVASPGVIPFRTEVDADAAPLISRMLAGKVVDARNSAEQSCRGTGGSGSALLTSNTPSRR
jgi:hypothetical protein